MRFTLSPRARADLNEIWEYTQTKWGSAQAEVYIRDLNGAFTLLSTQPDIGKSCDEIRPGYFKFPCGSHILFYKKTHSRIAIVRILHQRMDYDSNL